MDWEDCESLVGLIPESGNHVKVSEDARHRKMSRKVSHANLVFTL